MKIISFSAVEILPALLNKTKTQTIRPAWKYVKVLDTGYEAIREKPARFKVGDKVKLVWKQRSPKNSWFCSICGRQQVPLIDSSHTPMHPHLFHYMNPNKTMFHKILGTATITEVFKIEMRQEGKRYWVIYPSDIPSVNGIAKIDEENSELAKRDGFKSAKEMFKWFNKHYDLSQPKSFWVYRWKHE